MAEVWIARLRGKHGFQKLVAIKTILPECAAEPTFFDQPHMATDTERDNSSPTGGPESGSIRMSHALRASTGDRTRCALLQPERC